MRCVQPWAVLCSGRKRMLCMQCRALWRPTRLYKQLKLQAVSPWYNKCAHWTDPVELYRLPSWNGAGDCRRSVANGLQHLRHRLLRGAAWPVCMHALPTRLVRQRGSSRQRHERLCTVPAQHVLCRNRSNQLKYMHSMHGRRSHPADGLHK